ncbi:MAG: bifunctional adenosylcobinamide kinase/adenosylcobinamide-phosphate guanylyltransferase [Vulcanimicrobiaceae bacterium]
MLYVATARLRDDDPEWMARIARHAARRPAAWRVVETGRPDAPALGALIRDAPPTQTVLVESLGTWLADRMSARFESEGEAASLEAGALDAEASDVVAALLACRARAIVVGEEVGWSLVPPYPAGRVFGDVLGRAQQRLAAGSDAAFLVVTGFALDLHALGTRVAD